jgi:hypothetical protein
VRNRTGQRIAVVIAVDGRNIISGKKSYLRPSERMYVLGPYEERLYRGWRTAQDTVHRFYFTDDGDSYAGALDDDSAMGVIAVASYREIAKQPRKLRKPRPAVGGLSGRAAAPGKKQEAEARAGTGFGEQQWSPSYRVRFRPDARSARKYFVKYEWHQALCAKRVIDCARPGNRFWPEVGHDDYAPYPPGWTG